MALVEWGDLAAPALGESVLEVTLVAPDAVGDARAAHRDGRWAWDAGPTGRTRWRPLWRRWPGSGRRECGAAGGRAGAVPPSWRSRPPPRRWAWRCGPPPGVQADVRADGSAPPRRDPDAGARSTCWARWAWPRPTSASWPSTSARGSSPGCASVSPRPRALAQSLGIGVIGVTSLDILTAGAAATGHRGLVLACVDARRGEVFAAVRDDRRRGRGRRGARRPRPVHAGGPGGGAGRTRRGAGARRRRRRAALRRRPWRPCPASDPWPSPVVPAPGGPARPGPGAPRARAKRQSSPRRVVPLYMREADARSNFARAGAGLRRCPW